MKKKRVLGIAFVVVVLVACIWAVASIDLAGAIRAMHGQ
jgi:hypothetical protein